MCIIAAVSAVKMPCMLYIRYHPAIRVPLRQKLSTANNEPPHADSRLCQSFDRHGYDKVFFQAASSVNTMHVMYYFVHKNTELQLYYNQSGE